MLEIACSLDRVCTKTRCLSGSSENALQGPPVYSTISLEETTDERGLGRAITQGLELYAL